MLNFQEKNFISIKNIGIIGLGLIGGSLAKTIRFKNLPINIYAYDADVDTLKEAKDEGIIDDYFDDINSRFQELDIIFLCAPVQYNNEVLSILKNCISDTTILTDVGSVKGMIHSSIIEMDLEKYFIGGHPMAGSEKSGYNASTNILLENAYYVLTPTSSVSEDKIKKLYDLVEAFGSIPVIINWEDHDYATAAISHVPHIIASSLVNLVKLLDDKGLMKQLAAGGFKDLTRIASSSPSLWKQITLSNKDKILQIISEYIKILEQFKVMLDTDDTNYIFNFFDEANDYRSEFLDPSLGSIKKSYEIMVDIPDELGIIAKIATLLSNHNISIKNIGIVHNREYEQGVLKIVFYDEKSQLKSIDILKLLNYTIYLR
ncbi:prephenate dehydrogenase [Natranaerovirga pectinivora]|uniref:Prephenate dehydrogenase n=1 Tax=Natranaerovirga pectinivora TaxID=682400 RepID=A0A4R3MRE6_9FIRM|nr:prephenate dehydrogenase [Natranaerovirga pectinivora]TCT15347.1 prephenate dehydrogenase [Natranaerovirga pectinivora]